MKFLLAALVAVCLVATAWAVPPPANGGYGAGWGMNPTNWNSYTGSFYAWGLYDPLGGGGGGPWVVGWNPTTYIQYSPITMELWIEMYSLQTYHYTSYQWHRLGNAAETICFDIEGLLQSNNGQYISLTAGTQPLTNLWFQHNIFGGLSPTPPAIDIPISWSGQWGTGLVYDAGLMWEGGLTPSPDLTMLIPDPSDHWFQFTGCFTIPYHKPDGYYTLTAAGCPAPVL